METARPVTRGILETWSEGGRGISIEEGKIKKMTPDVKAEVTIM